MVIFRDVAGVEHDYIFNQMFLGQKFIKKIIRNTHPNRFGIDDFVSILLIGGHIVDDHSIFTNRRFHVFLFEGPSSLFWSLSKSK